MSRVWKTLEKMEQSIKNCPKFIILCDNKPVGAISCKLMDNGIYEIGGDVLF